MTSCLDFLSHEGHFSLPHSNVLYVIHLTAVTFNFVVYFIKSSRLTLYLTLNIVINSLMTENE